MVGFSKVIRRDPMFGLLHPDKKDVGPPLSHKSTLLSSSHPCLAKDFPADKNILGKTLFGEDCGFIHDVALPGTN